MLCDGLALAELFFASAVVMGFNSSASGFPDARRKPEEEDRGAEKLKREGVGRVLPHWRSNTVVLWPENSGYMTTIDDLSDDLLLSVLGVL